ncbi:MAG: hypothetical protein DI586_03445 [Micavibrio aeruginosavorus]|uniref:Uncharacterized protein n=1 Tax=Micavibrio aeruginosavorus TaxID=349221 RepID=A0A2W5HLF1_9BACT|nr:MAG: hypothetical protein DI586_03445 [Micavibrio aeruginosavorus]
MKKFIHSFLALVMLTPGLACGPFMAATQALAAQPAAMADMPDCKGMMGMEAPKKETDDEHVFFKDCSKADLFSADHAPIKAPDFDGKVIFQVWASTVSFLIFNPDNTQSIRGPPPDWPDVSQTQPSILLTTQRLRV